MQKGLLEAWNEEVIQNQDGVMATSVIFKIQDKGANATNLETGGVNATDWCDGRAEITEVGLEWQHCAGSLTVDINLEWVGVPCVATVSAVWQSPRSRKCHISVDTGGTAKEEMLPMLLQSTKHRKVATIKLWNGLAMKKQKAVSKLLSHCYCSAEDLRLWYLKLDLFDLCQCLWHWWKRRRQRFLKARLS